MPQSAQLASAPSVPSLRRYAGGIVMAALFLLLWCNQYESFDGKASVIYDKAFGGVRWIDIVLLSVAFAHAVLLLYSGRKWFHVPSRISRPSWVFLLVISFAFIYGWRNGGEHLFFDWREIALGAALTLVFSYWVRTPAELKLALRVFAVIFSVRIILILGWFLAGGGTEAVLGGLRTPIYDGATLTQAGFLGILGLSFCLEEKSFADKLFWAICGFLGYLLVFAAFRRTFWGEVFIALAIFMLTGSKVRLKMIAAVLLTVLLPSLLVLLLADNVVVKRLASFDLAEAGTATEYGNTNLDHINDILDALDHVKEHPLLGIGLGRPYRTTRIVEWKTESSVVHNALVHVWLFYGLAGLITYLWFHVSLYRWLRSFRFNPDPLFRSFAGALLAYVFSQFLMAAAFAPWPYGQLPNTIFYGFAFGSLFACAPRPDGFLTRHPHRELPV